MTREEVRGLVCEVVAQLVDLPDTVREDEDLSRYGLSSFDVVRLVLRLEERLGIAFPDENLSLRSFLTLNGIVAQAFAVIRPSGPR
ncbi:phosphopantetheine-binding protein [Allokutzneria oryzae]|uniref:Phosphopantetheine-binding protein n=1 Tax=Allokutzneria oryzae TaxID=1378989 RepID=A0ABV5ZXC6_9PSEU